MAMATMVGGHPLFLLLEKMTPTLFDKTKFHDFYCEVCELTKHQHVPFPMINKKETSPFTLIQMDV